LRRSFYRAKAHLRDAVGSHFQSFLAIRAEFAALKAANAAFTPSFPAAVNPMQRAPMRSVGQIWIEDETASATVQRSDHRIMKAS
jgi:hypothetical protein